MQAQEGTPSAYMVSIGTKRTQTVILGYPDVYITGHPFLGLVITETLSDRQVTLLRQVFIQAMEVSGSRHG